MSVSSPVENRNGVGPSLATTPSPTGNKQKASSPPKPKFLNVPILSVEEPSKADLKPGRVTFTERMRKVTSSLKSDKEVLVKVLKEWLDSKQVDTTTALDDLIYGKVLLRVLNNGRTSRQTCLVCDNDVLRLIFIGANTVVKKVKLKSLTDVSFGKQRGSFLKIPKDSWESLQQGCCLSLHFTKIDTVDLIFESVTDTSNFIYGLVYLLEQSFESEGEGNEQENKIRRIWTEFDKDHSDKLDYDEFKQFLTEMAIVGEVNKRTSEQIMSQLFERVDKDSDGKIDYNEFLVYYRELTGGQEFQEIFLKYSHNKEHINVTGLMEFMKHEQKEENFRFGDAVKIIIDHNTTIKQELKHEANERLQYYNYLTLGNE